MLQLPAITLVVSPGSFNSFHLDGTDGKATTILPDRVVVEGDFSLGSKSSTDLQDLASQDKILVVEATSIGDAGSDPQGPRNSCREPCLVGADPLLSAALLRNAPHSRNTINTNACLRYSGENSRRGRIYSCHGAQLIASWVDPALSVSSNMCQGHGFPLRVARPIACHL